MKTKPPSSSSPRTYKCRHTFCPNRYSDVIGGDDAFGKRRAGAVCVPCLYVEQMLRDGQTIAQIEAVPHLMKMFASLLGKTGWTWTDVADSFRRMESAKSMGGQEWRN